jgi:hypothetical protein
MDEIDYSELIEKLHEITEMGWVPNARPGNNGGVGNTLEDLLGIAENNFQCPDYGQWELKAQRQNAGSLLTLFHSEPEPREYNIVQDVLLLDYGWKHKQAGIKYPHNERSFRGTLNTNYSARGFCVYVDDDKQEVQIDFDFDEIDERFSNWASRIENTVGTGGLDPYPYWSFQTLEYLIYKKLNNLVYCEADCDYEDGTEYFRYSSFKVMSDPTLTNFLDLIRNDEIYVDFDARTGHNHGTKFRINRNSLDNLYNDVEYI